jgi:uncharacterized protein DUF4236
MNETDGGPPMDFFFRKRKKIAPGVRLNISKRGVGRSAGARGARVTANMQGEASVSGGRGGLHYRKRLRKGKAGKQEISPKLEEGARNLEFGTFVVEKATRQGLTGPGDAISDEFIAEAAEEFFGDSTSPEAQAAIAYVSEAG